MCSKNYRDIFKNLFKKELKVNVFKLTKACIEKYKQNILDGKIIEDNIPKIVTRPLTLEITSHSENETNIERDNNIEKDINKKIYSHLEEGNTLVGLSALKVADPIEEVNLLNEISPVKQLNSPEKHNFSEKSKSPEKPKSFVKLSRCSEEPNSLEPSPKKVKFNEMKKTENLKIVFYRQGETNKYKSQLLFINKLNTENSPNSSKHASNPITCTSKCNENTNIINENPVNLSSSIIGTIRVRNVNTMMHESMIPGFNLMFLNDKQCRDTTKRGAENLPVNKNNYYTSNEVSLDKIEYLLKTYFTKNVQNTIVIIGNILNIISIANKQFQTRLEMSFKKRTEAEKLKVRYDANRQHMKQKKVLEDKLKFNFSKVIDSFHENEFETAFKIFFLSLLTVQKFLDQSKLKKNRIFKNLVLLFRYSLKSSGFKHPKMFDMLQSKSFRLECFDLIRRINRSKDPGIIERMALFLVPTVNSREYFQTVINAVTNDTSRKDLSRLIETSSRQCCDNSFQDPIPSINTVTNITTTVPSFNNLVSSVIATSPI